MPEPSADPSAAPSPAFAPGLVLVSTPIGNLGDVTLRALAALREADLVLCEDTRATARLLAAHGVRARTEALHDHNEEARIPALLERLRGGARIALVSDAGTPLISDPGFKLVREASQAGHGVIALPGPSSVLAALSVAALPTVRFFFEGFLSPKQVARQTRLPLEQSGKVLALDQLHREKSQARVLGEVVHAQHVRARHLASE